MVNLLKNLRPFGNYIFKIQTNIDALINTSPLSSNTFIDAQIQGCGNFKHCMFYVALPNLAYLVYKKNAHG